MRRERRKERLDTTLAGTDLNPQSKKIIIKLTASKKRTAQ